MVNSSPSASVSDVVLIVDDVPDNLSLLYDALDESGYTVIVATNGEAALQRAAKSQPDIILLDAVMPGLSGFEVAQRLKADNATSHIPIIFMTGLSDTEHVVHAFQSGGADYVIKPIRPREVLARIETHLQNARNTRAARNALDAFGHASLMVRLPEGRILWQTPLARRLMQLYFANPEVASPPELIDWLHQAVATPTDSALPPSWTVSQGARRLIFRLHEPTGEGEWMLILQEVNDQATLDALIHAFKVTVKEAEVLYWVAKGKTNRDIGDILGSSPGTVKKHLERIYEKLGVETRTAAAGLAVSRVSALTRS